MKSISINKEVTNALGEIIGTAKTIDLTVQYTVGEGYAKGYYELKDSDGNVIAKGNESVPTTGWGDNDDVIYTNFLTVLNIHL